MTEGHALPVATPETREFWDATGRGELRICGCGACEHVFLPPQSRCPRCGSDLVESRPASGRGRIVSAVVSYLPATGLVPPFVLAVVALDEGAQLLTNIVEVEPSLSAVPPDLAVEVVFEPLGEVALPLFRPARAGR